MSAIKRIVVVIVIQFCCVGVGFWVQQQFIRSFSNAKANDTAWSEMKSATDFILREIQAHSQLAENLPELKTQLRSNSPQQPWELAVVDDNWQLMTDTHLQAANNSSPSMVQWKQLSSSQEALLEPTRGVLDLGAGQYAATAIPLPKGEGHVVVYVPTDSIRATTASMFGSLSGATLLAFAWTCTMFGIATYMVGTRINETFSTEKKQTDTEALQKERSLVRTQDAVIFGLAKLAESRDPDTGLHLERISLYATTLAQALRHHPRYSQVVNGEFVRLIGTSSALHDIGKVGIEDKVLLKPGVLNESERAEIQKHAMIGADCLSKIEHRLGASNFLQMAREIAQSHHECWDGSGYPDGLTGTQIPLSARIVAIADVYDALATRRVYKPDLPHEACVGYIERGAGTQFDPVLVAIFLEVHQQFRRIAEQNSDRKTWPLKKTPISNGNREYVDIEFSDQFTEGLESTANHS